MHYYNSFDQLIRRMVLVTTSANTYYTYNAQGIRTAKKTPDGLRTAFLLDGGNVVAEVQNNTVTQNYLRGINLIRREAGSSTEYYLFNAHGDVVNLVNTAGVVTRSYDYDAFGVEKDPDPLDINHFRYCGEYLDAETGRYYLRARYYDPLIGRFTQRDTHWNTANMIYGDNPQKINEREDKLGLKTYSYAPQISAIVQSGNLYVYGINNPVAYSDRTGSAVEVVQKLLDTASQLPYVDGAFPVGDLAAVLLLLTAGFLKVSEITGNLIAKLIRSASADGEETEVTVDDLLKDATPGRETHGKSKQYDKEGDYDDALDDFDSLDLKNITQKDNGTIVGETNDGKIVNVRNRSTYGSPTLEIYDPATGKSIKIRYK